MKPEVVIAALVLVFQTGNAGAQQVCMPQAEMVASLIDWYGEAPTAWPDENREQLWTSALTGSWTVLRLTSAGDACVIATGTGWRADEGGRPYLLTSAD